MKLYLCSDIHNDFHKFIPNEPVDIILCAGDMTDWGNKGEHAYIDAQKWLDDLSLIADTYYIPGNHDIGLADRQLSWPHHKNVLHQLVTVAPDTLLHGVSLSMCYDKSKLALVWENMTANPSAEQAYYADLPYCDILLSHSPPTGPTGTCRRWGELGSSALRDWIERSQPKLVVCGHIHSPVATEEMIGRSRVINVARKGMVIDFLTNT
jgi:Icc-related predicted phosphoesterase